MWFTPCTIVNVVTGAKQFVQNNSQLKITGVFSPLFQSLFLSLFSHLSFNDASRSLLYYLHIPIPNCLFLIFFAHFPSCDEQMWHCHCVVTAAASQPLVAVPVAIHRSWSHLLTHLNGFPLYTKNNERRQGRKNEKSVTKVSMVRFCVRSSPFALYGIWMHYTACGSVLLDGFGICWCACGCVCHCMEHHFMVIRVHYQIW